MLGGAAADRRLARGEAHVARQRELTTGAAHAAFDLSDCDQAADIETAKQEGPGEVFLSGTTRDLLDGSGFTLEHRGDHELKGLSGARPIFALRR